MNRSGVGEGFVIRHCVVGAGFAGLPVAKKLMEIGDEVVVVDRNPGPGGLWHTGAYEHASIISSRRTTELPDYPMPGSYPDFPSKAQMARYLGSYAAAFDLNAPCRFGTSVRRVRPGGLRRWIVELDNGQIVEADTVTIATGHHSTPRPVSHPGEWDGAIIRSDAYRDADQLRDLRVLVIGNGNTGCDIAVTAARMNGCADISMRSGTYLFPKLFLGVPTAELGRCLPVKGEWVDRLIARVIHRCAVGDLSRYGLAPPGFRILDKHPVVNSDLPSLIRHGRIKPRPAAERLEGHRVHFVDGTTGEYDLIVYAVGYQISFPFLHPEDDLLDWEGDLPILHSQLIVPKVRGLFITGLGQARAGGGPLFQETGYLVARMAAHEARSSQPITEAIDRDRMIGFARAFLGYRSVARTDTRSHGIAYVTRGLRHLRSILDGIGCPDAPSRTARAIPTQTEATGQRLRSSRMAMQNRGDQ
ncbi:flavin-containing monooxygenase [Actinomadura formosensis]|nr:NAD(P)/FAD-dependent oxidoreductase [Actinomadura formosensis]